MLPEANDGGRAEESSRYAEIPDSDSGESIDVVESAIPPDIQLVENRHAAWRKRHGNKRAARRRERGEKPPDRNPRWRRTEGGGAVQENRKLQSDKTRTER